ncbi:hypothetical protein HPB51_011002 [Rhipicephalus microplus]|uniref:Uncharacterized protein n=1 Tax=Rhipicephalus microplus TaxID=6941 RepID=A0A9J6EPG1_RHIMP|nr:hypothetical protein HPB51_011002 [Rhipicephalus microplus]
MEDRAVGDVDRGREGRELLRMSPDAAWDAGRGLSFLVGLAAAVAEGGLGLGADVRAMARSSAIDAGLGLWVAAVDTAIEDYRGGEGGGADKVDGGETAEGLEQDAVSFSVEVKAPSCSEDDFDVLRRDSREGSMTTKGRSTGGDVRQWSSLLRRGRGRHRRSDELVGRGCTVCFHCMDPARHFVNNAKSESQANPAYLPILFPDVYKKQRVSGERHERWAKRIRSAARNLTLPHPPEESAPVDVLSNASEADCSPDANAQSKALEQGSLLLREVEVDAQQFTLTCIAETQTDPVCCKGPLQLMPSATDGTHGSTQVTHDAQADKVIFFCT